MDIWRTLPPLAALRAFAAWADCGSMTVAGQRLNVSHAAISQQIRALEAHLSLSLVDRSVAPPRPTAEGMRLADSLQAGFAGMARTISELTGADQGRPLQITTSPSFAGAWLLPRLSVFRAAHPEISLMLDPTTELRMLTSGGIDLAIRYGFGNWPGVESQLLFRTPLVVVAAPAMVQGIDQDDLAALTGLPWIHEPGTDDRCALFGSRGLTVEGGGMVSLPGNLMIEAARAGQGIAILSRLLVQPDLDAGRLRLLHQIENAKGYWLVHRSGSMRPEAKAFGRWILQETQEFRHA
jgi:LysR family glycine cleavage system transcriptional activator